MTTATISPVELAELLKSDSHVDIIDVRTPVEFRAAHLRNANNVPLDQLDPSAVMQSRNGSQAKPLYVICQSGSRGRTACQRFQQAGFSNVINVEGGTTACEKSGLPVELGRQAISLERQVRIVAGFLVLIGAVLAWQVHLAFVGLSAFVGAGLMFAGITDTCGMAMMLAKMPWNRC